MSRSSSSSDSDSSSDDTIPAPKPQKSSRPFQVSQIRALSNNQPSTSTTSKRTTSIICQPEDRKTKPKTPLTPHGTLILEPVSSNKINDMTVVDSSDDNSSDLPERPFHSIRESPYNHPMELSDNDPKPARTVFSRTKAQLERDMNTTRNKFEEYQARADKRLDRMEDRQSRFEKQQELVLEKLDTLISQTSQVALPTRLVIGDKQVGSTYFVMAKEIQGRRDRDKAIEKIPSECRSPAVSFTRLVAKAGLGGVVKLTSNVPGFYYKHGLPDFFPVEFTGDDGYCKPYPHYNLSFAENHPWFSTFLILWRSMIPEDGSEFVAACVKFTDRQILVLLHDGPFSSLAQAWKRENPSEHTEEDPVKRSAKKRADARSDSKTLVRLKYRPELPLLVIPAWNATWSKSVMSPELTDEEGGKWIKRPRWRAGWNSDIYDGIDAAEWSKELAKPGVHRPLARRTIEFVDGPPPVIYSGKGKNKILIRYPLAMLSKRWRKTPEGVAWMKASAHLIDADLKHKPDISAFLKAHPPLKHRVVEGEDEPKAITYNGETEGGDEVEVEDKVASEGEGEDMSTGDINEIEIDPQLPGPGLSQAQPKVYRPLPCELCALTQIVSYSLV
ncbi:hypothetical protein RSOL_200990 [Rhizoctonia solani AG-3 Rhs1AP]|uniref:Uncharacterized protein n=2 Tax=Rhizoctonia solani AG-3 TaxID=1086053 RepID=A0A074RN82_9AGAM|nr:hypothetical protein RSOL_200990 [Rhizoctonia solani AG-3 Rhs1AP]KEP46163.1 hypothetical protein V565_215150 [Rhizoctonia solani 123E]